MGGTHLTLPRIPTRDFLPRALRRSLPVRVLTFQRFFPPRVPVRDRCGEWRADRAKI